VAAVPGFCLHGECDFSCCALARKVPPSLFPPASSVAHPPSQFLRCLQPWQGLLDLKLHLTAGVVCRRLQGNSTALPLVCAPCFWELTAEGMRRRLRLWQERKRESGGFFVLFYGFCWISFLWDETLQSLQIRRITTVLKWLSRNMSFY